MNSILNIAIEINTFDKVVFIHLNQNKNLNNQYVEQFKEHILPFMTLFGVIQQGKYLLCPPVAYLSFTQNKDSAGSAGGRQAAIDSFLLSKTRPRLRAGNY